MQDIRNEDSTLQHIIFMDADIIVVDDLRCVFETSADFDIALTFRNNKAQPINSGVIMVRGQIECVSRYHLHE
jgi:HKD family nuclease